MNIIGIERIVYGVTDLPACVRYLNDWGFHPCSQDEGGADFETAEKTVVSLRHAGDASLPPLHHQSLFFTGSCG